MIEAGFGRQDYGIKLGQLAESLIRLARFVVVHQAARRGHVGRAGRALLPRRSVHGGSERAPRSRARHLRSDVSRLQRRQADAAEAAAGLQTAAGQVVFAADVSRHAALAGHRALLAAPAADARRRRATCSSKDRCRCTSTSASSAATGSSRSGSSPIRRSRSVRSAAASAQADVVASDSVQGHRLVHHRLREEGSGRVDQVGRNRRTGDSKNATESKSDAKSDANDTKPRRKRRANRKPKRKAAPSAIRPAASRSSSSGTPRIYPPDPAA